MVSKKLRAMAEELRKTAAEVAEAKEKKCEQVVTATKGLALLKEKVKSHA
jgi:hypothetical protein